MSINPPFCDVGTALEEIRAGRMIVVIDDEDRENEGDLTMAAEKITPDCAVSAGSEWKIGSNRRAATGRGDTVSFYQRRSRLFLYPRWPQPAAVRKALPQYFDRIGSEFRVRADHRKFFGDRLRQDYPVERVAVMGGKLFKF
jgi:hypothetical protein